MVSWMPMLYISRNAPPKTNHMSCLLSFLSQIENDMTSSPKTPKIMNIFLWALTLLYPWIAQQYLPIGRVDPRLVDPASLLGGYLFVAVSGVLYVALGLFASSLTRSTLVAGMLAFSLLFVLVIGSSLLPKLPAQELAWLGGLQPIFDYLPSFQHLADFSVGVIDTRPFFLYLSNTLLVLGLTTLAVEARGGT